MSSNTKKKSPEKQLRSINKWKKVVLALEIIFGVLVLTFGIIMFVPSAKMTVVKLLASTSIGKNIINWFGNESYENSVFDKNFDDNKLKTNDLGYNYSDEYTNFVLFGVDSRVGEVDSSNSDSILIVSIHNTTGEVKMVSVYRDTLLGIYDSDGNLNSYFKVNSAYSNGGAEAAINTLNKNLDLNITDYVTVNFSGVAEIIDTLGGIKVNLTDAERAQLNQHLKSTISSTGQYAPPVSSSGEDIKLNGIQATTYCRIRKATFYDPETGEAVRDDFGRAARQRLVIMKLVERAKKAGMTQLTEMVSTVLNEDAGDNKIISTSMTFDEIVNLIPVVLDFELSGSEGFPSTLTTGTIDNASYVIPSGLSANVTVLHNYLYGEESYVPTENVESVGAYITGYTGVSEYSAGYKPTEGTTGQSSENETEPTDFDYDDGGDSDYY